MIREKSCGACVFRKNGEFNYLLLHYEAGHWDFVKGQIELNESEKETVVRELEEETGITDAQFIKDFREKVTYFYRRQGQKVHKEVVYYLILTRDNEVKLSYEHVGYKWLNYSKAVGQLTFNNTRRVLKKAHKLLNS